jgi:hypothetical protein
MPSWYGILSDDEIEISAHRRVGAAALLSRATTPNLLRLPCSIVRCGDTGTEQGVSEDESVNNLRCRRGRCHRGDGGCARPIRRRAVPVNRGDDASAPSRRVQRLLGAAAGTLRPAAGIAVVRRRGDAQARTPGVTPKPSPPDGRPITQVLEATLPRPDAAGGPPHPVALTLSAETSY